MILRYIITSLLVLGSSSLMFSQSKVPEIFNFPEFEQRYFKNQNNDTLYVFNFWATWCAPCVKELPYFEKAFEVYRKAPVRIMLVSLDAKKKLDTQLLPFLEKRKLKNQVILLSHPNANEWIDKVSPDWSGAIPATVFMKREQKAFYEQSFEEEELIHLIQKHIDN